LEFADEVYDRLVYVIEVWSGVHRWDDSDMLFGAFECDTHCLFVASPLRSLCLLGRSIGRC
jgi:hypothetical protein